MYYRLIVPYIALDLPVDVILTYNRIEENDPLVAVLRYSLLIPLTVIHPLQIIAV